MPRLSDRIAVDCSVEQTSRGIDRFLNSFKGRDGVARLRLRVPTDGPPHGFAIDREVRIEVRRPTEAGEGTIIVWKPEGTVALPTFEGTLVACSNGVPDRSYIELEGSYTPPFGVAGQIFDAAIGKRIAQATAREFLKDLKAAIEKP